MAIPLTNDSREYNKFVDSPTRPAGQNTAVEVVIGNESTPVNDYPTTVNDYTVVSVTNTATPLRVGIANLTDRKKIIIQPKGSTIYVGYDNTVTAGNNGNGLKVSNGSMIELFIDASTTVYAIKSSGGSVSVHVAESK